jgi:hypothetical protein
MARTLRSFLVAVLLAVGSIHGSFAAAAATAGGQVEVGSVAKVGRFGSAIVTVWATCRDAVVADLVIDVVQGSRSGTLTGTQGLICDGQWHRLRPEVSPRLVDPAVDGPFEPGPARVDARLSLLDLDTLDPLPQAFDSAPRAHSWWAVSTFWRISRCTTRSASIRWTKPARPSTGRSLTGRSQDAPISCSRGRKLAPAPRQLARRSRFR